jgi:hypothetical protein
MTAYSNNHYDKLFLEHFPLLEYSPAYISVYFIRIAIYTVLHLKDYIYITAARI